MSRVTAAVALAVVATVTGAATSQAARSVRPAAVPPSQVEVIACHITWDSSARKPAMDRATGNGCHGVWRVSTDGKGRIVVTHAYDPVIGIEITPNESTAVRGLTVGASGGGSITTLTVHDTRLGRTLNLGARSDAARLGSTSGVWLKLTHDAR